MIVEIMFLFFNHEIFLDIEVTISNTFNSTEDLRLILQRRNLSIICIDVCFIEVRRLDAFVRVKKICFLGGWGESEYSVHRKKNANL